MLGFAIAIVSVVVGLVALDWVIARVLPIVAPFVPKDFCGPEGWLMDTEKASGIFDRPTR